MINRLYQPISPATLAAFRIIFASLMIWEISRHWAMHETEFPPWEFWALYGPLEFLRDWYSPSPDTVFLVLTLSAIGIFLGFCTPFSSAVFFAGYVYQFLLDPTHWNNHYYLISLLAFWLIFTRSEAIWSLDARLRPKSRADLIPRWHTGIFQLQMAIVYFFGGLAKLRSDWLAAEPVYPWLKMEQNNIPLLGPLLAEKSTAYFVAYFGLIFDLTIPFLLVYRRTRPFAIVLAVLFHLSNTQLFDIGIFPFLGIGSLILFLEPNTPRKFARRVADLGKRFLGIPAETRSDPPLILPPVEITASRRFVAALLGIYVFWQLVLPFRHFLYKGDVEWTEEGKHFAWRMMLSHKETFVGLLVVDSGTGIPSEVDVVGEVAALHGIERGERKWFVHERQPGVRLAVMVPEKLLSRRHRSGKGVWGNPRLLAQYARYLANEARELGMRRPKVFAKAVASLNGRPFQFLVDPEVDLARAECPALSTPDWIVPLKPNQPIGNYPSTLQERYDRVMDVIEVYEQQKVRRR